MLLRWTMKTHVNLWNWKLLNILVLFNNSNDILHIIIEQTIYIKIRCRIIIRSYYNNYHNNAAHYNKNTNFVSTCFWLSLKCMSQFSWSKKNKTRMRYIFTNNELIELTTSLFAFVSLSYEKNYYISNFSILDFNVDLYENPFQCKQHANW